MDSQPQSFQVLVTGQLESAQVPGCDFAYARVQVISGQDWQLIDGAEDGLTQASRVSDGSYRQLLWNFPIELAYKSTNAFGWPQILVTVYGLDGFGRDVIKGYGWIHVPTTAGRYSLQVRLFKPQSSSLFQGFMAWLFGVQPEYADPTLPVQAEGREVTRVVSRGKALIMLSVLMKDMEEFGYCDGAYKSKNVSGV